jgi:hypothetical protein
LRTVRGYYSFKAVYKKAGGAAAVKIEGLFAAESKKDVGDVLGGITGNALRHIPAIADK